MDRFERQMHEAEIARKVLEVGQMQPSDLVEIEAASQGQKDLAGFIRISAVADVWENIKESYRTPEFARVIIAAVNRHKDARWWCDRESARLAPKGFLFELRQDIKDEKAKGEK